MLRATVATILSACLLMGCSAISRAMGLPPHLARESPPPGISEQALSVGSVAPRFDLPSATSGATWSLGSALGKGPAVLVFYRGQGLPHCRKQLEELQENLEKFEARGAQLVAISVDPPDKAKELATKLGVTFPLLSDRNLATIRAYGVEDPENGIAWPAIFIVSQDGGIRWRSLAETFKDRPTSEVVLEALGTTQAPAAH